MSRAYAGSRRRLVHDLADRLAPGNTTVGFCLGGVLAALLITWIHLGAPAGGTDPLLLILALVLAGTVAALSSGRERGRGLAEGAGFAAPGLVVALLLSPAVVERMNGLPDPLLPLLLAGAFALSFGLAGGLGALIPGQGRDWVARASLGLGIGGAAGGSVLAVILLSLQRSEGREGTALPLYLGSVCLSVVIAYGVGGSRLDAERRVSMRVPVVLPFGFTVRGAGDGGPGPEAVSGVTRDISLGGFGFESEARLLVEDLLSVEVRLADAGTLSATGRVVRRVADGEGKCLYGVEFLEMEKGDQDRLFEYYLKFERSAGSRKGWLGMALALILVLLAGLLW